jgi:ATP-dependent DNA helicase RecG
MPSQQNIEYKSSWQDLYLIWVCGIANTRLILLENIK